MTEREWAYDLDDRGNSPDESAAQSGFAIAERLEALVGVGDRLLEHLTAKVPDAPPAPTLTEAEKQWLTESAMALDGYDSGLAKHLRAIRDRLTGGADAQR